MAGDETMEVVSLQAKSREVIPAAHIFPRGCQAGDLPEHLEHAIVIQVEKARMIFVELALHRSVMELDIAVGECRERGRYGHQALLCIGPRRERSDCIGASGSSTRSFEESPAVHSRRHMRLASFEKSFTWESYDHRRRGVNGIR